MHLDQFTPGTYSKLVFKKVHNNYLNGKWVFDFHNSDIFFPGLPADKYFTNAVYDPNYEYRVILQKIHDNLDAAVAKHVANTDHLLHAFCLVVLIVV